MKYSHLAEWVTEAQDLIKNTKVVHSFLKFENLFCLKFKKSNSQLIIHMDSKHSFCFFDESKELPFEEHPQCKIIDTHLRQAKLTDVKISDDDRVITFDFYKYSIYNEKVQYCLILELLPYYSNIILIRYDNNPIILDCLKKVSYADNPERQILPTEIYTAPKGKFIPEKSKIIFPLVISNKYDIIHGDVGYDNLNDIFSDLLYKHFLKTKMNQIIGQKEKSLNKIIKKKQKKIEKLQSELTEAGKEESLKQEAELLKAHYHILKPGLSELKVINYYSEEQEEVVLKLHPDKSPQKNIEIFFKRYRKARDGKEQIKNQIDKTILEIEELEHEIFDINEIDSYVEAKELLQKRVAKNKKTKDAGYRKLRVSTDWEIFIGRTSTENDKLTTRFAKNNDWWFHTRVFQGTHVILRNYKKLDLPDNLRILCCRIAAYYSKAKNSSNVPVDYTQIRYVRKPRGSAPGYVTYTNQKTFYAEPLSIRDAAKIVNGE
jgi:predicted ribosome quality control (RQC) complex YloA/Tae2 family protein